MRRSRLGLLLVCGYAFFAAVIFPQYLDDLTAGLAFPGIVRDDTPIFDAATKHGLNVLSFEVLFPDASFAVFEQSLKDEFKGTRYTYGFPDGNGDGGSEDESGHRSFGETWLFQDNTWRRMEKNFDTDPRDDHGFGYHRVAKKLIMLEGVVGARGILVREASGWRPVEASPIHPRHQCSPLAWDDELLLHGGESHHGGPQFDTTMLLRMPAAS